ncbi:hypothetical protein Dimus_033176 [Dionaea muscipula]
MSTIKGGGRYSVNGGKGNNNNNNSGNSSNGVAAASSIPTASKKIVQSLKEVVNYPEVEIYAMLKECNMNPDEAVERLLSQDQFHEVKSKREKKKEVRQFSDAHTFLLITKDAPDTSSRGASNRGGKGGADRYAGRGGTSLSVSSESVVSRGKSTYKKDNEATGYQISISSASGSLGNNLTQRALYSSDPLTGYKEFTGEKQEGLLSSHPSGFQPAWSAVSGQKSMADIVKMGRPYGKASSGRNVSQQSVNNYITVTPSSGPHDLHSPDHYPAMISEMHPNSKVAVDQHVLPNDDWPLDEHPPTTSLSSIPEPSDDSEVYIDPSNLHCDRLNRQLHSQSDEVQYAEDDEQNNTNFNGTVSATNKVVQEDSSGDASGFEDELYENVSSYQVHRHAFDPQEVEDVSMSVASVATNLQQLNLEKDDEDSTSETGSPAVKIPEHLQVQSADCSHLSFGSFGSGMSGPFSRSFAASKPLKTDFEMASVEAEAPPTGNSDTRNPDYSGDKHLLGTSDGNIARLTVSTGNYDSSSTSQPDVLKQEAPEVVREYSFPSSTPNYAFVDNRQLNPSLAHSQTNPQMQNLPPLSSVMAYSNSLPSSLLASNVQSARESELPYSTFPITQSMPPRYSSSSMSSISGPTISLTEALKTGNFTSAQPSQSGSSISGGAAAAAAALQQQHLAVHPYSQPSLPLGHFANMVGFPFLPQSYAYVPSAFQQSFAGNSSYHQSLAAMLPQYKNSVSVNSLPQSAAVASAYGAAFGNSTPGNFPLNQSTAPAGTPSLGYDDILSSQYKDANHVLSLQQQNESSPLWVQGPGSRTMSAVPASTYYSFQGQSQQPAGFRQSQQHYGNLGYQNFYNGLSLEHQHQQQQQQQLSRDGGSQSQGGQAKQSQQIWQNNY